MLKILPTINPYLQGFCCFAISFLILIPPSLAQNLNSEQKNILQVIQQANIIYLGETHDREADHLAQLTIIQTLQKTHPKLAIAWEMFQRPDQQFLDQYLENNLTEIELQEKTEYEDTWGFPWEFYAPILRLAKAYQLLLIALNTPTEISRKVAHQGLTSLTPSEQKDIPPLDEIITDNQDYRQMLEEVYLAHSENGQGNSDSFEKFFTVQVLWDETMAEAIAKFYLTHPDYKIIVLVGKGHLIYNYGIPSRVARRLKSTSMQQITIFMSHNETWEKRGNLAPADYIWE